MKPPAERERERGRRVMGAYVMSRLTFSAASCARTHGCLGPRRYSPVPCSPPQRHRRQRRAATTASKRRAETAFRSGEGSKQRGKQATHTVCQIIMLFLFFCQFPHMIIWVFFHRTLPLLSSQHPPPMASYANEVKLFGACTSSCSLLGAAAAESALPRAIAFFSGTRRRRRVLECRVGRRRRVYCLRLAHLRGLAACPDTTRTFLV